MGRWIRKRKTTVNDELACLERAGHWDASEWEGVRSMGSYRLVAFLASPLMFLDADASLVPDVDLFVGWV